MRLEAEFGRSVRGLASREKGVIAVVGPEISGRKLRDYLKVLALLLALVGGAYATASVVGAVFGSGLVAFVVAFANGLVLAILSQLALRIEFARRAVALDPAGTSHWVSILSNLPSTRVRACAPRAPPA